MKLLIAYDGSSYADAALDDLQQAGLPAQVEAVVLSVADVWPPPAPGPDSPAVPEWAVAAAKKARAQAEQAVNEARAIATKACQRLQADFPAWQVQAEAHGDSLAWAIIKKAEAWPADLIVVGPRGRTALQRMLLGSVSQKVVTEAPCSVRVARKPLKPAGASLRLAIGLDGSSDSNTAVQHVAGRRWPAGTEAYLMTVADYRMLTAMAAADHPARQWTEASDQNEWAWVDRMTAAAAETLKAAGLAVSSLVEEGDPKQFLVTEAENWQADCIFVGARGHHGGLESFLLGSVATAVATRAHCTVEVVRSRS
jgi:nucleotide-binding universal stress UspA family protein